MALQQDMNGFEIAEDVSTQSLLRAQRQQSVWEALRQEKGELWWERPAASTGPLSRISRAAQAIAFKKLCRKGVPQEFRGALWMGSSGAAQKKAKAPQGYFHDLVAREPELAWPTRHQIDLDLGRTFPSHAWLRSVEGQAALRRVLVAYALRDSAVGYCQGMNFVAGMLLVSTQGDEESAFWLLAALLEDILFADCFTTDLFGCHQEGKTFHHLLRRSFPRLAAHLDAILDLDLSIIILEWIMCLFATTLPPACTLRMWDIIFTEASIDIFFGVALALFGAQEARLLGARSTSDVIQILRHPTDDLPADSPILMMMADPDLLLHRAFQHLGVFTTRAITKHREMAAHMHHQYSPNTSTAAAAIPCV